MSVRIDKWLQVARIFKTRTQAVRACRLGRVTVNGEPAKPHRLLSLEDRVEVEQDEWKRLFVVKDLQHKPVARRQARTLYEDLSPPRPRAESERRFRPALREKEGVPQRESVERWNV